MLNKFTVASFAILAVVILAVAVIFRKRNWFRASLRGPGGFGAKVETRDRVAPGGSSVSDAISHAGTIESIDHTGRRATIARVQAYGDIRAVAKDAERGDPKKT